MIAHYQLLTPSAKVGALSEGEGCADPTEVGRIPESKAIGASGVFVSQKHHLLFPTKGRVIAHYNPCRVVGPSLRFGVVEQLDHGACRHIAGQGFSGVDVVPIRHDPLPNAVGAFDVYVCR